MSTIAVEKSSIKARQEEVAQIIEKHSNRVFGHPHATIREVRVESIRQNLEKNWA